MLFIENRKEQMSVTLDKNLIPNLKKLSQKQERSVSYLINQAIIEYYKFREEN